MSENQQNQNQNENVKKQVQDDPWGCVVQLDQALHHPELKKIVAGQQPTKEQCRAAYWVALSLGECRLFGANPGELDGVMPPLIAAAAARFLSVKAEKQIKTLSDHTEFHVRMVFDARDSLGGGPCFALDILDAKMNGWAAFIAISEAFFACEIRELPAADLQQAVDHLLEKMKDWDQAFEKVFSPTHFFTCFTAIENWSRMLTAPYNDPFPWWMEVMLEEKSKYYPIQWEDGMLKLDPPNEEIS